jgi:hypothetical protein
MNLTNTTKDLIGAKYLLGSMNITNGLDCFSLIINYLRNIGYDIPIDLEFKGYNFKNYAREYDKNPDVINIGYEYLSTFLKEVVPQKTIAGDILFAKLENNIPSFGIDSGNGNMIMVSEIGGVQIIEKKYYTIKRALRCRK